MTRDGLAIKIQTTTNHTKQASAQMLETVISALTASLLDGDTVTLRGFGTFTPKTRPARAGHNPKTGLPVHIPARRTVTFTPGKDLKQRL